MFVQFILRFSRDACFHVNSIRFFSSFFFAFWYFFVWRFNKMNGKMENLSCRRIFFSAVYVMSLCVCVSFCMHAERSYWLRFMQICMQICIQNLWLLRKAMITMNRIHCKSAYNFRAILFLVFTSWIKSIFCHCTASTS